MTCQKNYDLVSYLRNESSPEEQFEVRKHLTDCAVCREEYQKLVRVFETLGSIEEISPSPDLESRILATVDQLVSTPASTGAWTRLRGAIQDRLAETRLHLRYLPPWAISTAAVALLLLILSFIVISPVPQPSADAYKVVFEQPAQPKPPITYEPPPDILTGSGDEDNGWKDILRTDQPDVPLPIFPDPYYVEPNYEKPLKDNWVVNLDEHLKRTKWKPELSGLALDGDRRLLNALSNRGESWYRQQARTKYGGSGTGQAVKSGLKWLSTHQEPDGSWDPAKYDGMKEYTVGLTSLVLLTFLGDGHTHQSGQYSTVVDKSLQYLTSKQQASGVIGPERMNDKYLNYMYNHGIASLALLELYALTGDKTLVGAVEKAVRFTINAQNNNGGWGYIAKSGLSDTSVSGWQIPPLRLAQTLKIPGVFESLQKSSKWLASITDKDGRVGYRALNQYPNGVTALTAVGMFCQLFMGWSESDGLARAQQKIMLSNKPEFHPYGQEMANDFYYWYFGSLAMFMKGGEEWSTWNKSMKEALLQAQIKKGYDKGTWEPVDRWSSFGGRLYTTSMAVLTLQVYYRYPPVS